MLDRHLLMVSVLLLQRTGPARSIKRDTQVVPGPNSPLSLVSDVCSGHTANGAISEV